LDSTNSSQKALFGLLYFVSEPQKAAAIANDLFLFERKTEYEIKQFLRAAGSFAKDNDGYFIRYFDPSKTEGFDIDNVISRGETLPILFRQPNEIRMRMAYDVLAGWILKFLYQEYSFIPLNFNSGRGTIWIEDRHEKHFVEQEIWSEFIDWLPEDIITSAIETLMSITGGKQIGKIHVPLPFVKKFGKAIAELARRKPSKFQTNVIFAGNKSHKELAQVIEDLIIEEGLDVSNLPKDFSRRIFKKGIRTEPDTGKVAEIHEKWQRNPNISLEEKKKRKKIPAKIGAAAISGILRILKAKKVLEQLSTPQYFGSLRKKLGRIQDEINSLKGIGILTFEDKEVRVDLTTEKIKFVEGNRSLYKFVLSRIEGEREIKKIKKILKESGLSIKGKVPLLVKDVLISKNEISDDKLWDLLYVEPVNTASMSPFLFGGGTTYNKDTLEECISCGSLNIMKKAGRKMVLPESKKRFYDRPNIEDNPSICPECFFASMISCFYPTSSYSVCEIPVSEFSETFFLAERMSNLTVSLGAMQLSHASLYSVLPSKYIIVRLNRGGLPTKTQLYLLFSEYADSFFVPYLEASIQSEGLLEKLRIFVSLLRLLGLISNRVRPPSFVIKDRRGYASNEAIVLLEKGLPYLSLYKLISGYLGWRKNKKIKNADKVYEKSIFKSPYSLKDFDKNIVKESESLIKFLIGGDTMLKENPKEFYEDVKKLSESLYSITQPLAQQEVNEGGSNVSVVVRKYTDLVSTDFPKLNLENFQYIVAKRADEIEKGGGGYPHKSTVRKQLEELENDVVEIFYKKYFENGNPYLWRQFILEVNARLLSKLLLNVHARRED